MVVGDLGVIDEAFAEGAFAGAGDEVGAVGGDGADDARQGGGDIAGEVAAVGAGVADEFVAFVEGLGGFEGLLGGEAEEAVGVALEFGEVVEQGRGSALGLKVEGLDGGLAGEGAGGDLLGLLAVGGQAHGLGERLFVLRIGALFTGAEPRALVFLVRGLGLGVEGGDDLDIVFGDEGADGEFAFDDHGEGGGLDAADGEVFAVGEGVGAGEIHADEPIGAAAAAGGVGEGVVIGGGAELVEAFADGVGGERGDPEAADGFIGAGGLVDIAEDEFAFAAGVGGADDLGDAGGGEDFADGFELGLGLFVDDEGPLAGEHGEGVAAPLAPGGIDLGGFGEGGEVADGPGDHVAIAVEEAIALAGSAEDLGNIAGDRGFFGKDGDVGGFPGGHGRTNSVAGGLLTWGLDMFDTR